MRKREYVKREPHERHGTGIAGFRAEYRKYTTELGACRRMRIEMCPAIDPAYRRRMPIRDPIASRPKIDRARL